MYRANKLSDLRKVYEQVVRDLSTVYSIGYSPSNKTLDGKWRSVEVRLVDRPISSREPNARYHAKLVEATRLTTP